MSLPGKCELCGLELIICIRSTSEVLVCVCCDPAFQSRHEKENCHHLSESEKAMNRTRPAWTLTYDLPPTELETLEG